MSNDDRFDDQLRGIAHRSMERRAAAVDTDTALSEHRSRRNGPRTSARRDRRWLAAAAAAAVVVAGIAAIAWPREADAPDRVATQTVDTSPPTNGTTGAVGMTTEPPNETSTTTTTTTSTTTTTAEPPTVTSASASPPTVRAGGTVEISPAGSVQRSCSDIVTLTPTDPAQALTVGQIVGDDWVRAPSNGTPVTYPACEGTTSDEPVAVTVPADVPAGEYDMCITQPGNSAGCATVTIETAPDAGTNCEADPLAPPSLVDGTQPADPVIEEQEGGRVVRWGSSDSPFAVSQALGFPIDTSWIDNAIADERAITAGDWQATTVPVGDPPISLITIYLRNASDGCVRTYTVGPGLYANQADALAEDWVTALSTGEPIDPVDHSDIGLGYFGRRPDAPTFEIEQFTATGSVVATLADDEVAPLFDPDTLSDGTTVRLQGNPNPNRCANRPLIRSGEQQIDASDLALDGARSIAVTASGTLLATRDVCPTGTKWGDPQTASELVALDPTSQNPSVVILRTWPSDPAQIVLDDGDRVIAFGEQTVGDVSPDGRYISLREQYASDSGRWSVVDLDEGATTLSLTSMCEDAGDVVGPPRFVDDNTVVFARLCVPLDTSDDSQRGDVHVEVVELGAGQPGDSIVWSNSVPGLGVDDFTRTVDLSARQDADDTIWAIVAGNGGLDIAPRSYALRGDEAIEITRIGYRTFAFQAADLISDFDTPPT